MCEYMRSERRVSVCSMPSVNEQLLSSTKKEKIFTTQRKNHRQSSLIYFGLLLACVVLISSQSHAQSSSARFVRFGGRKNNIGSIMSPENVCALCAVFRNILKNVCNFLWIPKNHNLGLWSGLILNYWRTSQCSSYTMFFKSSFGWN